MSLRPSKKTGLLWGLRGIGALEHQDKSMRGHSKRKAAVHKEKKGSTETPPTYILLLDFQSPKLSLFTCPFCVYYHTSPILLI